MEKAAALRSARTAGNENTALIKLVAIFFMLIDHVGVVFFAPSGIQPNPNIYNEMRLLGRIAMPLFCWGIVVGTEYTRNIWIYFLRILAVGVVAQFCFMLGLNHRIDQLSVFATLGLGVLAIAGIRWKRYGSQIWMPILAIFTALMVEMDYGWRGVVLVLVLYGCRKSRGALAAGFTAYCLYLGLVYGSYSHAFGVQKSVLSIPWMKHGSDVINLFFQVEFWAILALPLILIPMKSRWRVPKWISYGVYPFHLLVLGVILHWSEIVAAVTSWIGSGTPPLS